MPLTKTFLLFINHVILYIRYAIYCTISCYFVCLLWHNKFEWSWISGRIEEGQQKDSLSRDINCQVKRRLEKTQVEWFLVYWSKEFLSSQLGNMEWSGIAIFFISNIPRTDFLFFNCSNIMQIESMWKYLYNMRIKCNEMKLNFF